MGDAPIFPEGYWPEGFAPGAPSAPATNDESMASLTEQWICERIAALVPFGDSVVEPFPGSTEPDGDKLIREMTAHRSPYVAVLFEGDTPHELQEGQNAYDPTYGIYVVVQNLREGSARKGDGTTPGTNLLRDLLRNALHRQRPDKTANGFYAQNCVFNGVRIVFQRKDAFIMRAEVIVREVPV